MNQPTSRLLAEIFAFTPRPATNADLGYIFSTLEANLRGSYRHVSNADFAAACRELISSELAKDAQLLVAGEPGALWGWCMARAGAVVFVYVRKDYRGAGIASRLLAAAGVDLAKPIPCRFVTPTLPAAIVKRLRHIPVL